MRRLILIGGGALVALALLVLVYPAVIGLTYGNHLPGGWSPELTEMTLGEIQARLGPPQEEASAKDFQNWVVPHWWGRQILKVISQRCCQPEEKPFAFVYLVYVYGRYDPVVVRTLGEKNRSYYSDRQCWTWRINPYLVVR